MPLFGREADPIRASLSALLVQQRDALASALGLAE
ncbi:hypothetical protein H4W81_000445 [Nonomuraea africana]|uniref:MarR family transcriptional regulator n=1 Tax=Nonomuraea africana TaxID=46171 RepID=A0ABR9K786_9ACTN|nr:hypothetical protein [Nonomuraea africana]